MRSMFLAAVAALAIGGAAQAATPDSPLPQQASVPFVNHHGIRDWHAADDRTLYVQDNRHQWYRATLFARCFELPFAQMIGFETRGIDSFDRFSSIRVRGERCQVSSLVASSAPPPKAKRTSS